MKTNAHSARRARARRKTLDTTVAARIHAVPFAGLVLAAGAVQAQDASPAAADPAALEEVVITATGTNISGVAPVGVQSVTISREQMEAIGAETVADVVRTLPQIQNLGFDGAVRENGNANQTGNAVRGTSLNLRGLGQAATLVLVDGHRLTPSGTAVAFLEAIQVPPAAIERIEVVPDGASAVYGSDAISGVVNYVLRKNFDGLELSGTYTSNSYQSDWSGSLVGGKSWQGFGPLGRGNVILSYSHFRQNPVLRGQIPYYREDLRGFGGLDNRLVNNVATPGPAGNIRVANQPLNTTIPQAGNNTYYGIPSTFAGTVPTLSELRLNQPNLTDRSDYDDYLPLTTRNHVTLLFNQNLTDWLSAYYEGFYTKRETVTRTFYVGNGPQTQEIVIQPGTPFYIPGIPGTQQPNGAPGPITVQYNEYAHAPLGVRFTNETPEETVSHTGGLRASLPAEWNADWFYTYGSVKNCGVCYLGFYLDPGGSLRRAVNEGFINPFSSERLTDEQWKRVAGSNIQRTQNRLYDTVLKLDGPLFSLPGGRVRTAVGFEYSRQVNRLQNGANRSRSFIGQPDPPGSPDLFIWDALVDESRYQHAAFTELFVPIIGPSNAKPLAKSLSLSAAFRYDSYSDFGSTTNPKLGFTWELSSTLSLRGSWGTAFRAPSLPDINNGLYSGAFAFPTINNSGDPNIPVSFTNGGVNYTTVLFRNGGNPALGPEEGRTWTAGFDFTPGFLGGFRLSGTYFNIVYDSQIIGPPGGDFLKSPTNRAIYASMITPVPASPTCVRGDAATAPAAIRDALENPAIVGNAGSLPPLQGLKSRSFLYGIEQLSGTNLCDVRAIIDSRVINAAKTSQDGVDLQANYAFDALESFWNLGFSVSKILSSDQQFIAGSPELSALDRINFPVSLRGRTTASWNRGSWSATFFGNYVGSYTNDTPIQGRQNSRVPSWTTFDMNVGYRVPENTGGPVFENMRVGITVQNLFDRDVPIVLTGSTANDARNHDPLGRSWQFSFTKQF